jgi:hypothetical protein
MSLRVGGNAVRELFACVALTLAASTAHAQDLPLPARTLAPLFTENTPLTAVRNDANLERRPDASSDRGVLVPLYISFASLQMLDAHSTMRAMRGGAVETNPLMRGIADRPAALVAVKAGVAVSTIVLAEKMRGKSRVGAIVLMAALNSAYATIVAHNYRAVP